ncbi:MAG TPA: hypothetical protein VIX19_19275 [Terriglobales bacterium]
MSQTRVLPCLLAIAAASCFVVSHATAQNPVAGTNVNMVSGTDWTTGDPFLQRQNEPSAAVSTRNPLHLLAGANDYRTVDLPGLLGIEERGDAWLGVFKSFDGGQTWQSTLPGYPLDSSADGLASPLHGLQAGADPAVRAGTNGLFYMSAIAFNSNRPVLRELCTRKGCFPPFRSPETSHKESTLPSSWKAGCVSHLEVRAVFWEARQSSVCVIRSK